MLTLPLSMFKNERPWPIPIQNRLLIAYLSSRMYQLTIISHSNVFLGDSLFTRIHRHAVMYETEVQLCPNWPKFELFGLLFKFKLLNFSDFALTGKHDI